MLSIVIPAYMEEKRLSSAIEPILGYLKEKKLDHEIIIVADKSPDKTVEVAKEYADKFKNIKCIYNPKKRGKGYAVKLGMLETKGDLVLMADADTSTPITELDKFLPKMDKYDIVIGSRAHRESNVENKLVSRVVLGNAGNILLRLFLIKKIKDTQCGFKLFKGAIARELFAQSRIDGFGFDFEIVFLAQKKKYRIFECPVNWVFCEGTKVTWQSHFVTLQELFRIKLNHILGKYRI